MSSDGALPITPPSPNILLAAAGADLLPGKTVVLSAGDLLDPSDGLLWFPLCAVVRMECRASGLLGGWVDRRGVVGLFETVNEEVRPATWIIEVPGRAFLVQRAFVTALLARSHDFSGAVMSWLVQTVEETRDRAIANLQDSAAKRVQWLLSRLGDMQTGQSPLQITQADIARLTGLQRTTVCAVMKEMKREKQIAYSRSRITVREPSAMLAKA
ncbi:helix-turn-helix domain-containing protein [Brevundimonas sp. NIBR11]|uniref:Crp/Fnr family transcriptional regulator n=1 Tax=Brevundimonas sp. NIBR11 TaxID=3015999 RepID=UPI0022F01215|nr:helix-turn-helix domain-containing protein [Brevundimonas sp. NIBR11]WGM30490.1 hypothetical protein KKHFBJBL_00714 [Brevundimonas sp. NIBR11]